MLELVFPGIAVASWPTAVDRPAKGASITPRSLPPLRMRTIPGQRQEETLQ